MNKLDFFLSRRLMIEQRYHALKSNQTFLRNVQRSANPGEYVEKFVFRSYYGICFFFTLFSLLISTEYLIDGGIGLKAFTDGQIGFVIFLYALVVSVSSNFFFLSSLNSEKLIEPLAILPVNISPYMIPLSWFMFTGSATFFIIFPPIIISLLFFHLYWSIFFGLLWGAIFIFFGNSISTLIFVFLNAKKRKVRKRLGNGLMNGLKILAFIAVFSLFDLSLYFPQFVTYISPSILGNIKYFVPILNVRYIVFSNQSGINPLLFSLTSTLIYGAICVLLFIFSSSEIKKLMINSLNQTKDSYSNPERGFKVTSKIRSMVQKDIKIVTRKMQNLTLMLLPLFFTLPTVFSIYATGNIGTLNPSSAYLGLLSLLIISASFYSMQLIIAEGDGLENLRILPISNWEIIRSKLITGLIIFSLFSIPIIVILVGVGVVKGTMDFLIEIDLGIGYIFSSIISLRWLLKKIPPDAITVNFYSFNGSLGIIFLFALTAISAGLAPVAVILLYTYLSYSIFQNPYGFLLLIFIINISSLYIISKVYDI
ncbi:MAG: hypothetical protein ACYDAO_04950 [Thermoplasmataceae archaeon]